MCGLIPDFSVPPVGAMPVCSPGVARCYATSGELILHNKKSRLANLTTVKAKRDILYNP
jgi:hypothetical protein